MIVRRRRDLASQVVRVGVFAILASAASCHGPSSEPASARPDLEGAERADRPTLRYAGSSTIANFIEEAREVYRGADFVVDASAESGGAERVILARDADLVGVAFEPSAEVLESGVRSVALGTDTIAVLVNTANPVTDLSLTALRRIYTGEIRDWSEVGGRPGPIVPLVVDAISATHVVFRELVLSGAPYGECRVVRPDPDMPMEVEAEAGAIGFVSHSFVCGGGEVRVLNVDGETPLPFNLDYPIVRPLHLLFWTGDPAVDGFVRWIGTPAGEETILRCFGRPRELPRRSRPAAAGVDGQP